MTAHARTYANKTSVAIINFNQRDILRACLESVVMERPAEILVLDNGSTDDSAAMVEALFPQVELYRSNTNNGYSAAANRLLPHCSNDYIVLLNNDTVVQPGAILTLERYLDSHPRVGIAGPRLLNTDGSLQPSCFEFPTLLNTMLELASFEHVLYYLPWLRQYNLRTWAHNRARAVPWVLGAALAIRADAFADVAGFDERFFFYSEEIDLCYRLRMHGWETHFVADSEIVHIGGASTCSKRADLTVQLFRSKLQFFEHHYSKQEKRALHAIISIGMLSKLIRDSLRMRSGSDPERRARLSHDVRIWRRVLDLTLNLSKS
jgi:GT2 family glycosyltransferase